MATAARSSDLPGVTTARILEQMIEGYAEGLRHPDGRPRKSNATTPVRMVLKQALKRKWHHLASERIEDVSPTIPIGKSFWPLSTAEKREIETLFSTEAVQKMVSGLHNRHKHDEMRVRDAAYWVKGCSSLGRFRFAVLLEVGKHHGEGRFCLMDIKEGNRTSGAARFEHQDAERSGRTGRGRCVQAVAIFGRENDCRAISGAERGRSGTASPGPQAGNGATDPEEATAAARFLAAVVGKAHARQMEPAMRATNGQN